MHISALLCPKTLFCAPNPSRNPQQVFTCILTSGVKRSRLPETQWMKPLTCLSWDVHLCVKPKQRCAIWLENGSLQGIVSTVAKMLLPWHGTLKNTPQGCTRAPSRRIKGSFHSQTEPPISPAPSFEAEKNDGQPQAFCSSLIKHGRSFSEKNPMEMHLSESWKQWPSCFSKMFHWKNSNSLQGMSHRI